MIVVRNVFRLKFGKAKDALKQWRANRPKKTTSAYAKCKRLWKVSVPPPAFNRSNMG